MPPAPPSATDPVLEWSAPSGRVLSRVYPGSTGAASRGLMVFFPPGGFAMADLASADDCLKEFALACQVTIVASGYAVAPEHPFPAAVEDAYALLSHMAAKPSRVRGWTGDHLFVCGIEAGGNLAAVSALICRDRLGPRLAGQEDLLTPAALASANSVSPSAAVSVSGFSTSTGLPAPSASRACARWCEWGLAT